MFADIERERRLGTALLSLLGTPPAFDLACVGTSLHGLRALTFETVTYLTSADIVFSYPLTQDHYRLLQLINPNVVNVHKTFYTRGSAFAPAYKSIVDDVMKTLREGKKVVYATQGSPAFHCGTCVELHCRAQQEDFSSILVGGVSSFELLSTALAHYDISNVQLLSVPDLMNRRCTINPSVKCLLFDLFRCVLPAVLEPASTALRPQVAAFADLLRATYPGDHELRLLWFQTNGSCAQQETNPLGIEDALTDFGSRFGVVPTVFAAALKHL